MADRSAPFRIAPSPGDPGVRRGDGGRFIPATPAEIARQSASEGRDVQVIVQEQQAPEHPTPGARPHMTELPWGPAPAPRLPFRVMG